jgi:hypothetical protein
LLDFPIAPPQAQPSPETTRRLDRREGNRDGLGVGRNSWLTNLMANKMLPTTTTMTVATK